MLFSRLVFTAVVRLSRQKRFRPTFQTPHCWRFEPLERRDLLAGDLLSLASPADDVEFLPVIVAGDPNGSPPDSPSQRVDANTTTSDFAGVGSLFMKLGPFNGYICTATAIDSTHVLTAAHCLDTNNDGKIDFKPGKVEFNLNYGGNLTHTINASQLFIHPDFTGFNNPFVNDDLAIVRLESPIPAGVPIYQLYTAPVGAGQTFTMVGYGRSGDGINGYTVNASLTVKRTGANNADAFEVDDEGSGGNEVFLADFDGQSPGPLGGSSLGNDIEASLGGGDSGGPSFIEQGGTYQVAGVNTFGFSGGLFTSPPLFGSGLGGVLVHDYLDWIDSITAGGSGVDGGGGGGGGQGNGNGTPPGRGRNQSSSPSLREPFPVILTKAYGPSVDVPTRSSSNPNVAQSAEYDHENLVALNRDERSRRSWTPGPDRIDMSWAVQDSMDSPSGLDDGLPCFSKDDGPFAACAFDLF